MHRAHTAAVLLTLTIFPSWKAVAANVEKNPQFTVSVYNDARVPALVLESAERRAGSIFAHSSLDVAWLDCTHPGDDIAVACNRMDAPGHLALRVISHALSPMRDVVFGVSFLSSSGAGKYADVFWDRAEDLHAASDLDLGGILGSVMAHEIGHLLLGSNAHAVSGIMRARWEGEELRRIVMGTLLFNPQQEELMRRKVRLWEVELVAGYPTSTSP
jgi:hypothetical protein